jgi:signal transduction histidine kinase
MAAIRALNIRSGSLRSSCSLIAWVLWGLSVALLIGLVPLLVAVTAAAAAIDTALPEQVAQKLAVSGPTAIYLVIGYLAVLACSTLGAVIITRQPENRIGWIFCLVGLSNTSETFAAYYACYTLLVHPGALPGGLAAAWLQNWIWVVSSGLLCVFLPLLFPNGRLSSRRWRPVGWISACVMGALALGTAVHAGSLSNYLETAHINNPLGVEARDDLVAPLESILFMLLLLMMLLAACSVLLRLRHATGDERLQMKWFAYFGALLAIVFIAQGIVDYILQVSTPAFEALWQIAWSIAFLGLPIAAGIAILKYHLYAIDPLINRTLVYGALTAIVIGLYILIVGSLGLIFQVSGNVITALVATGLVAVLFQPLRARLQLAVNHLMYGERDDPYAVLTRLGQRLEATLAPDTVLPVIVETVAQALKLPYVAITFKQDGQFTIAAFYGIAREPETLVHLPLVYQSVSTGELLLAPRAPGEPFTTADRLLLQNLAHHVGVALHGVHLTTDLKQLTSELQRSQRRLVTTREEERRRLRRDLHDGLGSALTSMTFKLDAACNLLERDPIAVRGLLQELKEQSQASIADIRHLVYNLRPPILDEWGLVAALREQVEQFQLKGVQATVDAPETLPALAAAVEVAAYRIALEALANVIRHAEASCCAIRLDVINEALILDIQDNGVGLPPDYHAGVGVSAMHERAAELGGSCVIENMATGGARVSARLPLTKE